jgi:hypothetical protein
VWVGGESREGGRANLHAKSDLLLSSACVGVCVSSLGAAKKQAQAGIAIRRPQLYIYRCPPELRGVTLFGWS